MTDVFVRLPRMRLPAFLIDISNPFNIFLSFRASLLKNADYNKFSYRNNMARLVICEVLPSLYLGSAREHLYPLRIFSAVVLHSLIVIRNIFTSADLHQVTSLTADAITSLTLHSPFNETGIIVCLFVFYGISTSVGYSKPNQFLYK